MAGHPKNIIFLSADAFGVLPPVAKLSSGEAMYHFLSGYTAKVAGTGTKKESITLREVAMQKLLTCLKRLNLIFIVPFIPMHCWKM